MSDKKTPADRAIAAFAGVNPLSAATEIPVHVIYRWRRPKAKGGSGGLIQPEYQGIVLAAAQRLGLELTAADLVAMPDTAPAPATGGRA